ncbi:MAG: hypothetical protein WC861_04330 [Candidatus Micrarchaeia archaeon]
MGIISFISENKYPAIFALAVMLLGTGAYFAYGGSSGMAKSDASFYTAAEYKAGFADGNLKIFALAPNNALAKLSASEGNPIPEDNSMVVGASEAAMMRGESLFSKPGDSLKGFFGIDTTVEGILGKTGAPLDMFHFLSKPQFDKINGSKLIFALAEDDGPGMFMVYNENSPPPMKLKIAEGSMNDFKARDIYGKRLCPMAFGADEAAAMRSEKEFTKPGDQISGFFGNDVVVAAVLEKTNTPLDMMHIVSADCKYSGQ